MRPVLRDITSACEYRLRIRLGEPRERGFLTPWRRLHELLLEWSDDGRWEVSGPDGEAVTVAPGVVFAVMPGALHCLRAAAALHSNWALFDVLAVEGHSLLSGLQLPLQLPGEAAGGVKRLLCALAQERPGAGLIAHARANRLAAELFELLAGIAAPAPVGDPWGDPRVAAVLHHIQTNLASQLDRSSLARVANLSPTRLHYVFSAITGLAPMAFVRRERMRRAQHLLLSTRLSMRQIAVQCGFCTPQYFTTSFRSGTGYTPGAFRRQFAARAWQE